MKTTFKHSSDCQAKRHDKSQLYCRKPAPPLKMEYEYDGAPITAAFLTKRLGISLYHAERIVNAVNTQDALIAVLKDYVMGNRDVKKAVQTIDKAEGK